MTKKYSDRKLLTKAQIREAGMEFLKKNDFFGINPEHLEMGSVFEEIVLRSSDEFTIIRELAVSILKLEQEAEAIAKKLEAQRIKEEERAAKIKEEEERAAKTKEQVGDEDGDDHTPTIVKSMAISFVNDKDMTIGEVLAEVLNRYSEANLLDVKLSEIKTGEAQLAAYSKLVEAGNDKFAIGYDEHTCCEYVSAINAHNAEVMAEYTLPLVEKTQSPFVPFGFEQSASFKAPFGFIVVKK